MGKVREGEGYDPEAAAISMRSGGDPYRLYRECVLEPGSDKSWPDGRMRPEEAGDILDEVREDWKENG